MTDEQIIKALELCVTNDYFEHNCKVCSFKPHGAVCTSVMFRCVFDLINRQKAEIERLKEINDDGLQYDIELMKQEKTAKAKAVKEFAERLKSKEAIHFCKCGEPFVYTDLFNGEIDTLVKEMAGE